MPLQKNKRVVIKDEKTESVISGVHEGSCLNLVYPSVGFYAYKGGEFENYKMEEFVNKLGLKIEFIPAFSPWLNGITERNHHSVENYG